MTLTLPSSQPVYHYRLHGLTVTSELPLPELETVPVFPTSPFTDLHIRCEDAGVPAREDSLAWFLCSGEPGQPPWLQCAGLSGGYLLRFPGRADFVADTTGQRIAVLGHGMDSGETVRHLLLDHVIPLVLTLRGLHALHATAVLTPEGLCAFIGPSGAGKSTLAASFVENAYPVLADDCLVLDETHGTIMARPAYPGIRLWDDALAVLPVASMTPLDTSVRGVKGRVVVSEDMAPFEHTHPLRAIYALTSPDDHHASEVDDTPATRPCSPSQAVMNLLASAFRLEIRQPWRLEQELCFWATVAAVVPVTQLVVPDRLDALPAMRALILEALACR